MANIQTPGSGFKLTDSSGNLVALYGIQADGSVALKFFDQNGIGIAQFGKFSGQTGTFLKIALPGFEVGTTNQLSFTSDQITGIINIPSQSWTMGQIEYFHYVIPHNLGFVPNYNLLVSSYTYNGNFNFPAAGYYVSMTNFFTSQDVNSIDYIYYAGVDATNLYLTVSIVNENALTETSYPVNVQYYIQKSNIAGGITGA